MEEKEAENVKEITGLWQEFSPGFENHHGGCQGRDNCLAK